MSSGLQNVFIAAYAKGLVTNKKPVFLPDQAWQTMENAFCWRESVKKRQGLHFEGRLQRNVAGLSLNSTIALQTTYTFTDIFGASYLNVRATEPFAEIASSIEYPHPNTLIITIAAPDTATFTDNGDGTFTTTGAGVEAGSYIDYVTGKIVLVLSASTGGAAITVDFTYYPTLPVMGIIVRDLGYDNLQQTVWFDTKYAYIWNGSAYQEFIPGTTWDGTDSDFFLGYNYRGVDPQTKLLFITNFVNDAGSPMRYTDGLSWTTFAPQITSTQNLFQARILIAYYGRLLAMNCVEGTSIGSAVTIGNRLRFSGPLGADPTASMAWRTDIFGLGGLLDIPTNEDIISATFVKNTLIVNCEETTWQLRYIGEYGLPFVWERLSADYGVTSTFSPVLYENHQVAIGDKAIISSNAIGSKRIDIEIPEQVFDFQISNNGLLRVQGVRDYFNELIYWNYPDANTSLNSSNPVIFPNKVLVLNYRNNTWAIFRDNITAFGIGQQPNPNVTWDSIEVTWDDTNVTWDDNESQDNSPVVFCGNAQGWTFIYNNTNPDEPSLSIQGINVNVTPIQLTIPNHNLMEFETIEIDSMNFLNSSTFEPIDSSTLNGALYRVQSVVDANTITISQWNQSTKTYDSNFPFSFTPTTSPSNVLYVGDGTVSLFPKLNIKSKDINIYQSKGMQTKLSYIDFLMQPTSSASMTVNLFVNSSYSVQGNVLLGSTPPVYQPNMETSNISPFYPAVPMYLWFRYYSTLAAQYFNINLTYDDTLMNQLSTHTQPWELYAINAWCRPGGKILF